ncbi:hypothetical protein [Streptomyces sp. G1]|uniref:hypothetical protein n=1 Tax=Streptomyces sp. G1 TaxID=361572 RepID=UPI00202F84D6|nr:hypothetical protein [Streptomyces sp. G1]MCM1968748.1 hypothetical protein [Streptomyces sp. G1]
MAKQTVIRVPRHAFRTDNAGDAMAPIVETSQASLAEIETSEFERYDAQMLTLPVAKWHCLTDPFAGQFPTWEAWVTATQVGSALFAAGTATEGPVACVSAAWAR